MNIKYALFDLDGTLTDPGIGITNSIMYALEKFNITVQSREELFKFIGPPLTDSFSRYYGFSDKQAETAVVYYREYFKDKGIFENLLYPGVKELLSKLKAAGIKIILATSKPQVYAVRILEHFGIYEYFYFTAGSNLDGTRTKKDEVIDYALKECNIKDKSLAIMVGDRDCDIIGAKKCGISSVGVLFGYGSREEFEAESADFVVSGFEELGQLLLNNR